jgi:putative hemolysin
MLMALPPQFRPLGRVLAIANHPYGVIDGLVLCALMAEVRQDYKIITHRILRQAPAVMDKILPVDFDETEAALANNLKTRADAAKIFGKMAAR